MKFTLMRSAPADMRFATQHLTVEFDDVADFNHAQQMLDQWYAARIAALPEGVRAALAEGVTGRPVAASQRQAASPSQAPAASGADWDSSLTERYEAAIAKAIALTGRQRKDVEMPLLRAASVYQRKDGEKSGCTENSLGEWIARLRQNGKKLAWPARTVPRVERLVAALENDGHVNLEYKIWNRGERREEWRQRDLVAEAADQWYAARVAALPEGVRSALAEGVTGRPVAASQQAASPTQAPAAAPQQQFRDAAAPQPDPSPFEPSGQPDVGSAAPPLAPDEPFDPNDIPF